MVDAADLKSVVRMDVPVQVRPGPPLSKLIDFKAPFGMSQMPNYL